MCTRPGDDKTGVPFPRLPATAQKCEGTTASEGDISMSCGQVCLASSSCNCQCMLVANSGVFSLPLFFERIYCRSASLFVASDVGNGLGQSGSCLSQIAHKSSSSLVDGLILACSSLRWYCGCRPRILKARENRSLCFSVRMNCAGSTV
jgi:hypothetical protein